MSGYTTDLVDGPTTAILLWPIAIGIATLTLAVAILAAATIRDGHRQRRTLSRMNSNRLPETENPDE
jgi:hypothetical protein